ncbi:tetratricopeptide repeat protein [Singulisphaera acidiphila]|uniref:Tetratricopeptide repeat protein n=1 Tax=Singulisphaera acidiphila (strain ATCC BAA-1392 / DSM 18658 / VKM B-2454 / MOB10) TaxID=886293 RepID=L0DN65_SINAD|nr:tetratricopeptide repeat protein [Singulisphaera acidiphila]AGA30116.1 tetratricopeptide repeat protein [Singulisphaera acidiphila DSM 18658]
MNVSWERRSWRNRTLAAMMRPGTVLGLSCVLTSLIGCQTVPRGGQTNPGSVSTTGAPKQDASVAKTDFHRDVTQDQQFNVHLELGRVFESQKEYSAALSEYEKSLEACTRRGFGAGIKGSGEKQALAHRRIGGTLDRLGRFAQAEDHYRLALKASPDDAKVWNDSGYSYYLQSRWTDAERNLKTAAKLAPDDIRIQTNLGLTLAAAGKADEALIALSKAGGSAIAHANLGYLLATMGQKEEARAHYQTAIQLQPNLAPARQALAALDAKALKAEEVATTIPAPVVPSADASIRRTTGPSVTQVSVTPLPQPNSLPQEK